MTKKNNLEIIGDKLHFKINRSQPYEIYLSDLTEIITVHYPDISLKGSPVFEDISSIIHHLLTTKIIEGDLIRELRLKTIELYPENLINWNNTDKFIRYFKEYNKRLDRQYKEKDFESIFSEMDERIRIRKRIIKEIESLNIF